MECKTATVPRFRLGRGSRNVVLTMALACFSLQLAPIAAYADAPNLLAWGHHKKQDDAEKSNSPTNTSTSASTTTLSPGTIPGAPTAPGAAVPGVAPSVGTNGQNGQTGTGPLLVTPSSLVDLNSGRFGKLTIDLLNAKFRDTSIDRATCTAGDMDLRQGTLGSLNINVAGGHFDQFIFDEMILTTAGNLHFEPNLLLQEKVLQFTTPAQADVSVSVSQDSLNKFLADPQTLANLSVTASKRLGALASLFGASGVTNIGVTMHEAHIVLNKGNKIVIAINADLGMAGVGVPLSFEVDAQLGIKDGWVEVTDTHLMTNGQEISPQLSEMLVKKINSLASWGHKSDDIWFNFTDIKVVPGKQFSVKGTALIKRIRLTRAKDETTPSASPSLVPGVVVPGQTAPLPNLPVAPNSGNLSTPQIIVPANQVAPK